MAELGPIFLVTERMEEMADFYEGVIGLSASSQDPGHHVWYRAGAAELALHAPRRDEGPEYTPRGRGSFLWFWTEADLGELATDLRAAGSACWGPYRGRQGPLLIMLDPDGNMVGLAAR